VLPTPGVAVCGRTACSSRWLAYTGLRRGEVTALRGQDVDLAWRRLRVDRAMVEVNGRGTSGRRRMTSGAACPCRRFLVERLAEHFADRPGAALLYTSPDGSVL
jgi:integrase